MGTVTFFTGENTSCPFASVPLALISTERLVDPSHATGIRSEKIMLDRVNLIRTSNERYIAP
jgi:hypothetical protein